MHRELEKVKNELIEELIEESKDGINEKNYRVIDTLAHAAKNVCKLIEDEESKESYGRVYYGGHYNGMSYGDDRGGYGEDYGDHGYSSYGDDNSYGRGRGRGAHRDSMGRYASSDAWMDRLKDMERSEPDERKKREIKEFIARLEKN